MSVSMPISMVFLGAGAMAKALAQGLRREHPQLSLGFFSPSGVRARACADELGGRWLKSLNDLRDDDVAILACKPQQFHQLASELKKINNPPLRYISILAGIPQASLLTELPSREKIQLLRLMPALQVGLAKAPAVIFPPTLESWASPLEKLGPLLKVESEEQFHMASTFVGCFPGVIAEITAWTVDLGLKSGLKESDLTQVMAANLSSLGQAFDQLPAQVSELRAFRDRVSSQKGMTAAILQSLQDSQVRQCWEQAFLRGGERSRELSGGQ